mmetsp:Transcript_14660/g.38075  ORF Transcript_14660/g.38075 Transcript_14660/m.38075 type:complete len:226 (-) Transcript_14660:323-1000(-)
MSHVFARGLPDTSTGVLRQLLVSGAALPLVRCCLGRGVQRVLLAPAAGVCRAGLHAPTPNMSANCSSFTSWWLCVSRQSFSALTLASCALIPSRIAHLCSTLLVVLNRAFRPCTMSSTCMSLWSINDALTIPTHAAMPVVSFVRSRGRKTASVLATSSLNPGEPRWVAVHSIERVSCSLCAACGTPGARERIITPPCRRRSAMTRRASAKWRRTCARRMASVDKI